MEDSCIQSLFHLDILLLQRPPVPFLTSPALSFLALGNMAASATILSAPSTSPFCKEEEAFVSFSHCHYLLPFPLPFFHFLFFQSPLRSSSSLSGQPLTSAEWFPPPRQNPGLMPGTGYVTYASISSSVPGTVTVDIHLHQVPLIKEKERTQFTEKEALAKLEATNPECGS